MARDGLAGFDTLYLGGWGAKISENMIFNPENGGATFLCRFCKHLPS